MSFLMCDKVPVHPTLQNTAPSENKESRQDIVLDEHHVLGGIQEITAHYDGFILDMWGVIHDGVAVFPEVVDCLLRLREAGKKVIILSNAPRRSAEVAASAAVLGLPFNIYDSLFCSGEETWQALYDRQYNPASSDPWYARLTGSCLHLGPSRDYSIREGLLDHFTDRLDEAGFILCTGAKNPQDQLSTYQDFLNQAYIRSLPMICANPDLVVMRGFELELCAGGIADHYAALGGEVRYHGKPWPSVYKYCLQKFGTIPSTRILAIGDSMRTDVIGAQDMGLDVAFVPSGIHQLETGAIHGEDPDLVQLTKLFKNWGVTPRYSLPALRW